LVWSFNMKISGIYICISVGHKYMEFQLKHNNTRDSVACNHYRCLLIIIKCLTVNRIKNSIFNFFISNVLNVIRFYVKNVVKLLLILIDDFDKYRDFRIIHNSNIWIAFKINQFSALSSNLLFTTTATANNFTRVVLLNDVLAIEHYVWITFPAYFII